MWDKETGRRVAEILTMIADPKNLRPHPEKGDVEVFDGGETTSYTGGVRFNFDDGAKAFYGIHREIGLSITLPNGEMISIDSPYRYCGGCLAHVPVETEYCPTCRDLQETGL